MFTAVGESTPGGLHAFPADLSGWIARAGGYLLAGMLIT